jgi:hypothetical protein
MMEIVLTLTCYQVRLGSVASEAPLRKLLAKLDNNVPRQAELGWQALPSQAW